MAVKMGIEYACIRLLLFMVVTVTYLPLSVTLASYLDVLQRSGCAFKAQVVQPLLQRFWHCFEGPLHLMSEK